MTDKEKAASKAVAKRGIVLGSAHNRRSSTGTRITESTRRAASDSVRAALRKP